MCFIYRFLSGIHRFSDRKSTEKPLRAQRNDVSLNHQSLIIETMEQKFIVYPFRNSVIRPQYGVDD